MSGPLGERSALSIEPRSKGLGFVASDGNGRLIDWGGYRARPGRQNYYRSCARRLLQGYGPNFMLVEDCNAPSSRRRAKTRALIDDIASDAERVGIVIVRIKRRDVLKRFCRYGDSSTHHLAKAVCRLHPPLRARLPKPRKPWESEHYSTALFEAAARLYVYFDTAERLANSGQS